MFVKFRWLIPVDQIKERNQQKKGCIQVGRTVEFISARAIIGTSLCLTYSVDQSVRRNTRQLPYIPLGADNFHGKYMYHKVKWVYAPPPEESQCMSCHLRKVSTSHEDKLKNADKNNLKNEDNKE